MLIYLASPYTSDSPRIMKQRFSEICSIAGRLIEQGHHIFCPIAMAHPIRQVTGLESKFEFWQELDCKMIDVCSELWVATMDGWAGSVGVGYEIRYALTTGKTVRFLDPLTLERR